MIAQRLRNIDIVLSRPKHLAHKLSVDPLLLPPEVEPVNADEGDGENNRNATGECSEDEKRLPSDCENLFPDDGEHLPSDSQSQNVQSKGRFPEVEAPQCGNSLGGDDIRELMSFSLFAGSRFLEDVKTTLQIDKTILNN